MHKKIKVRFDPKQHEGSLAEIVDWCLSHAEQFYDVDWEGMSSNKQWFVVFDNENDAMLFRLRWS